MCVGWKKMMKLKTFYILISTLLESSVLMFGIMQLGILFNSHFFYGCRNFSELARSCALCNIVLSCINWSLMMSIVFDIPRDWERSLLVMFFIFQLLNGIYSSFVFSNMKDDVICSQYSEWYYVGEIIIVFNHIAYIILLQLGIYALGDPSEP